MFSYLSIRTEHIAKIIVELFNTEILQNRALSDKSTKLCTYVDPLDKQGFFWWLGINAVIAH